LRQHRNRHGGPSKEFWAKVFRIISKHGTAEHWATNELEMDELGRLKLAEASWKIEECYRGLKQVTNVEGCQGL
jgi:putative transposase